MKINKILHGDANILIKTIQSIISTLDKPMPLDKPNNNIKE